MSAMVENELYQLFDYVYSSSGNTGKRLSNVCLILQLDLCDSGAVDMLWLHTDVKSWLHTDVKAWLCSDVNISDAVNETNVMTFLEEVAHQFDAFVVQ